MIWRNISGYKFPYRISEEGEVQRQDPDGWHTLSVWINNKRAVVALRSMDGTQKRVPVTRLMDEHFFGGRAKREGLRISHRNGSKLDCSAKNLVFMTQSQLGKLHGSRGARRPVVRYDRNGRSTIYKSVKEAAEKNGMSPSTLDRRLYGGVLDPRGYRFIVLDHYPKERKGK